MTDYFRIINAADTALIMTMMKTNPDIMGGRKELPKKGAGRRKSDVKAPLDIEVFRTFRREEEDRRQEALDEARKQHSANTTQDEEGTTTSDDEEDEQEGDDVLSWYRAVMGGLKKEMKKEQEEDTDSYDDNNKDMMSPTKGEMIAAFKDENKERERCKNQNIWNAAPVPNNVAI